MLYSCLWNAWIKKWFIINLLLFIWGVLQLCMFLCIFSFIKSGTEVGNLNIMQMFLVIGNRYLILRFKISKLNDCFLFIRKIIEFNDKNAPYAHNTIVSYQGYFYKAKGLINKAYPGDIHTILIYVILDFQITN